MKKLLALVLCAGMLAGCGSSTSTSKVGMASITSMKLVDASADAEGQIQANTVIAAVVLDKDGKIVDVQIDAAQNSGKFDATGAITSDATAATPTKGEKAEDYGMKKASSIEKEWFEQVDALEAWMTGKTIDEVKAIEVDEAGKATNEDLTTSVTIGVNDFVAAVVKAAENAVEVEGVATVGMASATSMKFTDASADAEGSVQANTTYEVVALDKDGKVVAVDIDVAQNKASFSTEGTITSDAAAATLTKVEKGADYGMAKASSIGKEWFEQADALEAWMTGKTLEEIKAIEVNETGVPTSEDLTSSVTIKTTDYITVLEKAVANAK
ncbi:MAG: hypothetical protein ACRCZJ_09510 [Erysipelotrichaceae bacterium]